MITNKIESHNCRHNSVTLGEICSQHDVKVSETDQILFKIFSHLFKNDFISYSLISKLALNKSKHLLNLTKPSIENFVDMTKLIHLSKCLAKNASVSHWQAAQSVARKIYECDQRTIKTGNYGFAFPMNAELLSYAMYLAKNQNVLEIAGASGENAALLAFSDAKHVFMNDIETSEMADFKNLRKTLPTDIQSKLTPLEGSCLEILNNKPELTGTIGLVVCQNLIHFFNDEKQFEFIAQLKKLLKPDGKAIIVANGIYFNPIHYKFSTEHPEKSSFAETKCFLTDYSQGRFPIATLFHEVYPCEGEKITTDIDNFYLYYNNSDTISCLQKEAEEFRKLSPNISGKIETAISQNIDRIKSINQGSVRVVNNFVRYYSEKTLTDLFVTNGFKVENCVQISTNGHLFHGTEKLENVSRLAVVISKAD